MNTKNIKQTVSFNCKAIDLYEALMDSKQHAAFSGEPASIAKKQGGKFSTYSGYATGINLELIPGKKLFRNGWQVIGQMEWKVL